ncbi:Oxidoreductase [Neocucurbitaria cava]|uniref:Mitochondrial intermembrane space import and assembly protein 40 n=1 Tax=Neocucurbitaria cava TaxID=798079 RepID=A0A9W9CIS4_9PLEO|nr:Oxidoreductase [Neocucurbitaria cava]
MFRAAPRLIARPALRSAQLPSFAPARRYISTAPPSQKSRSWKSLVARLGAAGAIIYYYNTTDVFAEEPRQAVHALSETEVESEHLPTIEAISAERQKRKAVQAQLEAQKQRQQEEAAKAQQNAAPRAGAEGAEGGMGGLEEEADQQGAFNPETGEINWDCPCLGGMADGPCGPEFKAAFSCFVYSQEEPKGMDCIDKFKDMQNCFRQYPEVYGSELDSDADDEDDMTADVATPSEPRPSDSTASSSSPNTQSAAKTPSSQRTDHATAAKAKQSGEPSSKPRSSPTDSKLDLVPENYKQDAEAKSPGPASESAGLVPKAAFDTREANAEKK